MSYRKQNIRKACDEINNIVLDYCRGKLKARIIMLMLVKERTHRIKRTTWSGEK